MDEAFEEDLSPDDRNVAHIPPIPVPIILSVILFFHIFLMLTDGFIVKETFLGFSILKTPSSERPHRVSQGDLGMTSDAFFPGVSHTGSLTWMDWTLGAEQKAWQVSS